jgi:hypothetical protein
MWDLERSLVPVAPVFFEPFLTAGGPSGCPGLRTSQHLSAFGRDKPTERSGETGADLLATTRDLELVDIGIHGDRRASVSHLPLHTNRIEAALGEVRAVDVPQVNVSFAPPAGLRRAAAALSSPRVETFW